MTHTVFRIKHALFAGWRIELSATFDCSSQSSCHTCCVLQIHVKHWCSLNMLCCLTLSCLVFSPPRGSLSCIFPGVTAVTASFTTVAPCYSSRCLLPVCLAFTISCRMLIHFRNGILVMPSLRPVLLIIGLGMWSIYGQTAELPWAWLIQQWTGNLCHVKGHLWDFHMWTRNFLQEH